MPRRFFLLSSLVLGCAAGRPPIDDATAALDAACMRGEATCAEAAARYRALNRPEARERLGEVLYQGCRHHGEGCDELAELLVGGKVPPPARGRVAPLYEHVCGTRYPGDEAACMAAALHGRRCDGGHAPACAALADLASTGRLGPKAPGRLAKLHRKACSDGYAASCVELAEAAAGAERAGWLARACDFASPEACFALAESHAIGRGVAIDQEQARRYFARACELDHADGCAELADRARRGIGGGVDSQRAASLLVKGCDLGAPAACETLGRALERGSERTKPDPAAAYERYRRAVAAYRSRCDEGQGAACVRLGVLFEEGSGISADREAARALFEAACRRGEAEACLRLSLRGGQLDLTRLKDHRGALEKTCDAGEGESCVALARLGDEGRLARGCAAGHGPSCAAQAMALPLADEGARRLSERACALADPGGCHLLGTVLELTEPDLELALARHRDACLWGHAGACARAGVMRLRGDVRLEPLAAASMLDRGCELGSAEACFELGLLELSGERIGLDVLHGKGALERACRAGSAAGCGALGLALVRATRLPRDLDRGATLLRRACRDGDDGACLDLAEALSGQLPNDPAESRDVLATAAARGERRCEVALLACHGQSGRPETGWVLEAGHLRRILMSPPRCGAELERTCNTGREALRRVCALDGSHCWQAAELVRRMAAGGLAASIEAAREHEAAAVKWARPTCARGDAAACAVMYRASELGRGAPQSDVEADRYRARACELDSSYCP